MNQMSEGGDMQDRAHGGGPHEAASSAVSHGVAWSAILAIATIVVSLLAMALVPVAHDRRAAPVRELLRRVAQPARSEITALHLSLASGEALLRDHRESVDSTPEAVLLERYRAEVAEADQHTERLDSLAARWSNSAVDGWADSVRVATARWRATGEALVTLPAGTPTSLARARDAAHAENYSATLVAAARLDQAVAAGAADLQSRLDRLDIVARRLTLALAVLALAGAGAAFWLGLAVHRAALLAEARRQELAAVVESKARFTRGISHDLKNPLGAIDGHAVLLEEEIHGPLTDAQRQSLGHIRRSVRSLLALIDDLLALARAETGELEVRTGPVDLNALVRDVADEHRASIIAAGLTLETFIPGSACNLTTDQTRVRQVLGNLISNARKFTPRGGRVSLTSTEDGDRAEVIVSDTGPGIAAEHRDRLFREFSRLPGTVAPGAGLGLAIARRIAVLLGGELLLEPTPAEGGARFVLRLPLIRAVDAPRPSHRADARVALGSATATEADSW